LIGERFLTPSRGKEALLAFLALSLFQGALFFPYIVDGLVYMPVALNKTPPFLRTESTVPVAEDWAGSDKVVFNYPNVERWSRLVTHSPRDLLWNPDSFCGIPFLATQNTHVLYPLNAVFLWCPGVDGMLVSALIHGILASFLAFLFVRHHGTFGSALLSGAVFGGTGWFLAHHDLIQYIHSATWVPLILLGTAIAMKSPGPRAVLVLALGIALSFFGGMPQITILGLLCAGFYSVGVAVAGQATPRPVIGLLCAGMGVLCGLLFSAPQLLPTLEIGSHSGRSQIPLAIMKANSMVPVEAIQVLWPEILGNPPLLSQLGTQESSFGPFAAAGLPPLGATLTERIFYVGILPLVLILLALLQAPRDRRLFGGLLLLVLTILCLLGTPLLDALYRLPGFQFGNHRRLVFLVVLALSWLAAIGVPHLLDLKRKTRILASSLLVLIVGAGAMLWLCPEAVAGPIRAGSARQPSWAVDFTFMVCGRHSLVASIGVLALLWMPVRFRALALLPCLLLDMVPLHTRLSPGQDKASFETKSEVIAFLQSREDLSGTSLEKASRIVRYRNAATAFPGTEHDLPFLPPNLHLLFGLRDVQGYEAIVDRHVEELLERVEPGIAIEHHLLRELRSEASLHSPILDLLAVRYVIGNTVEIPGLDRIFASPIERLVVHERRSALRTVTAPRRVQVAQDEASLLAALSRSTHDPAQETWVLPEDAARLGFPQDGPTAFERKGDEPLLLIASHAATRVRITCKSAAPLVLRLAESYHPGWVCRDAEGTAYPIVRADHHLRLVSLPAGEHELTFSFEPTSFTNGMIAALGGLVLLVLLVIFRTSIFFKTSMGT
jgi:hypothetical protein